MLKIAKNIKDKLTTENVRELTKYLFNREWYSENAIKELFDILFKNLPDIELPLLISQHEYPEWVRKFTEDEFRTRQGRKQ